ncbi:MAG: hypothetical protein L6247_00720 [Desulfobacteraceae bacterium]|nr:hypothetical protein [Pseudomonadota bacterium]MCG2754089.1 hypothetical protein [Desulfobacteraceae bacterium]
MIKEDGLGKIFIRHLVMAIPWGIIFLIVLIIAVAGIKQQIKDGLQYAVRTSIYETSNFVLDTHMYTRIKQNIKEGIEFAANTGRKEVQSLLNDPQVKQDIKEAFECSGEKLR